MIMNVKIFDDKTVLGMEAAKAGAVKLRAALAAQ